MYAGRFFVSLKIRPIYSPITPKDSSCIPPKKRIVTNSVGNPCTFSPQINVFIMTIHI